MKTQCPHCQAVYAIKPDFLHKRTKCNRCGQDFAITAFPPETPPSFSGQAEPEPIWPGAAEPGPAHADQPPEAADSSPGPAARPANWREALSAALSPGARLSFLALAVAAVAGGLVGAGLMGLARQSRLDQLRNEAAAARQELQLQSRRLTSVEALKKELSQWREESRRLAAAAYPADSFPQLLAETAGLEYKLTETLLVQRIAALESGAPVKVAARGTAPDPQLAAALAEDIAKLQAELAARRPAVEKLAEPARSQAQAALATQELNLAVLNRNRLIAQYGLNEPLPPAAGRP